MCQPIPIAQITPHPKPEDRTLSPIANAQRFQGTFAHPLIGKLVITLQDFNNNKQQLLALLGTSAKMLLTLRADNELQFDVQLIGQSDFLERGVGIGPVQEEDRPKMHFLEDTDGGITGVQCSSMLRGSTKMEEQPVFKRV